MSFASQTSHDSFLLTFLAFFNLDSYKRKALKATRELPESLPLQNSVEPPDATGVPSMTSSSEGSSEIGSILSLLHTTPSALIYCNLFWLRPRAECTFAEVLDRSWVSKERKTLSHLVNLFQKFLWIIHLTEL